MEEFVRVRHKFRIRTGAQLMKVHALPFSLDRHAVRMPRRPQKTGGLQQKRRGYMTHAGLAVMAVAARLGPA
jgi:hypothetical protein